MTDDLETIGLRPAVVDGVRRDDDFEVIWRGLPIGRILKQHDNPHWWWGCNVYGQQPTPGDRGPAINFKDCQVRFKLAWAKIRPTLTEEAIAIGRAARRNATAQTTGCRGTSCPGIASDPGDQARGTAATGTEIGFDRVPRRRHRLRHPEYLGDRRST